MKLRPLMIAWLLLLIPDCGKTEDPSTTSHDAAQVTDSAFADDAFPEDTIHSASWDLSPSLSEIGGDVIEFIVDTNDAAYLLTENGLYVQEEGNWTKVWAGNPDWPGAHAGASLHVDENLTPRIAYRTYQQPFNLMFASAANGWQKEPIETSDSPFEPVLLHTSERTAVVVVTHGAGFYDRTLKVFDKTADQWSAGQSITDENIDINSHTDAALDVTGFIHAIYFDNVSRKCIYIHESGTSEWSQEVIGAGPCSQIAQSPAGATLIFGDERPCALAIREADTWTTYPLPSGSLDGRMAVDSSGTVHAVFRQDDQDGVFYATWSEGVWSIESITKESSLRSPQIALGAEDKVFVVFEEDTTGKLRLATRME